MKNIYRRKDGRYEARVLLGKDENGKRRYRSFYGSSAEEAEFKMLAAREPDTVSADLTEMTVKELTMEYITVIKPRLKESSEVNYRMKAEKHIIPAFGNMKCCLLKANDVYQFIESKLKSGLSARYVSDIIVLLKSVYRYASRVYGVNNCLEGIVMPKRTKPEIAVLSKSEQSRLMAYLNGDFDLNALGIALSLHIGIRIGELCALQWKDIDLANRTITVRKTVQRIKSYDGKNATKLVITEPKSASSVRVIPIPECLVSMLEKFKDSADKYILSSKLSPVEPRTMQYRFASVLKKANLPSVHFHSLRHAFATNCIALGFDVKTLSEILGHSSVEITLNRYVHSSLDRKRACMDMVKWAA
ncbi:MAG: site-specific integrase [Ruminiclostridium sp.]|nr:site-specific integrase [Ruminiclostridium sp.]